jgi:hypothetical protein
VLSNNHVLADENSGLVGDEVRQAGSYDGGSNADRIGSLHSFVPLQLHGANFVDAAIAVVDDGIQWDASQMKNLGKLQGVADGLPAVGAFVAKIGRTTGLTRGRVTAFDLDNVVIGYGIGALRFDDQLEIEGSTASFSRGGDSGSLIVDSEQRALALLHAGSDQGGSNGRGLTYANPIRRVLDELQVTLLT